MSFGMTTWRANGSVAMSGANKAGMFIELVRVSYSDPPGSKVYNQIPAGSMFVLVANTGGQFKPVIDSDGAGHARLNWVGTGTNYYGLNTTADTIYLVFAKKVNQTSAYGMVFSNNDGDMALDITYPVPQYVTTIQPSATVIRRWNCPDGLYSGVEVQAKIDASMRPGSNRVVLVNMPDSASTDIWYAIDRPVLLAGLTDSQQPYGNATITLTILYPVGGPYKIPSLHIFALDGPISGGGTYGAQYHDAQSHLVYDSSAENITISDMSSIAYSTSSQTLPLSVPTTAGVYIPFLLDSSYQQITTDSYGNGEVLHNVRGVMQRRGSSLVYQFRNIRDDLIYDPDHQGTYFNTTSGTRDGNFTLVVDISQLNPTLVQGS